MFDFHRLQVRIHDHYFRLFRSYNKPEEASYFIKRWLELLRSHYEAKDFVSFDPPAFLNRLVPKAKAVLLVKYPNVPLTYRSPFLSVFPYYPFRVKKETRDISCYTGLEFLHLYLELTGIRIICLYKIDFREELKIVSELQERYPDIKIYGKGTFDCFKKRLSKLSSGNLKCPLQLKVSMDKISRQEVP